MHLPHPLFAGILLRRYQRFLADILLDTGETVTAHCPNSGSMKGCALPGSRVLLSRCDKPSRRLCYTWELVEIEESWVGINTCHPNRIVQEAIVQGAVPALRGYESIRPEVRYGENSRIDLLLSGAAGRCYVEVKNVTMVEGGRALFPDAVTTRGQKHLRELMNVVKEGDRGVIFYVVQRSDGSEVAPADTIDPEYGRLLRLAVAQGVEAMAWQAVVTPKELRLATPLPVCLSQTQVT